MNTLIYNYIKKSLKKDWYTQGFNAVPIFLNHAAWSGIVMEKTLGFGYSHFLFHYQKGYGEMSYWTPDFQRIWKIIKKKIAANPKYLEEVKKKYNTIFQKHEKVFRGIDNLYLKNVNQLELIELLKKCAQAQIDAVGIAHAVDAIGIEIEQEFKRELLKEIGQRKEFNRYYALLTTPTKPSFVAKEEKKLKLLANLPLADGKKKIAEHFHRYFWIQNSYAGPKKSTVTTFAKRLKSLAEEKEKKPLSVKRQKNYLIKKLKLSPRIQRKVKIIDFASIWQDERKANVLKAVGCLGKVIDEISRRTKIGTELLYYLGVQDIMAVKSIADLKLLKNELGARYQGAFFLMESGKEFVLKGKEYQRLLKFKNTLKARASKLNNEIHGSVANGGTAVGRVVICKSLASLGEVKQGDILVTSMTRPEFMPALKKAGAIITDEGGITCHAAIVARELNIPAVIGTKIATQILKNGMIVEVKANHGVVKIV